MKADDMRHKIDRIDSEIIKLLSERSSLVIESESKKMIINKPHDHSGSEKAVMRIRQKASKTGLDPDIAEQIYRNILHCFNSMQMKEFMHVTCELQDI